MLRFGRRAVLFLAAVGLLFGCDSGGGMDGPNQAPAVTISSPSEGDDFTRSDTVTFNGSAEDPEEGALTGEALAWTSDADGALGTGTEIATGSLSPTRHTITLTATDSDGATGEDSISIAIDGPPTASISRPGDETAIDEGRALTLEGTGTDPVGGELSGDDLEWASDVDGQLGTGNDLSVSTLSPGPHAITLTVTDSDGKTASDTTDIVVESPGFDARLRFLSDFTPDQKTAIRDALEPWTSAITGDLAPVFPPTSGAEDCGLAGNGIDDLVLVVRQASLDGPGGTLAQAGPCLARTSEGGNLTTSLSGIITIDRDDIDNPKLRRIVTHEVGHALGIGIGPIQGWGTNVSGLDTADPFHAGANTTDAFDDLGSEAYLAEGVPIANAGGQGTRGGHWREENFDNELMTGFLNESTTNPLSRLSLAALADIGYEVDLSAADPYTLPMPQTALWRAEADATLSRGTASDDNFGRPGTARLDSVLVAGANNAGRWSPAPDDEVFSGLVRFDVPASLPAGVTVERAAIRLLVTGRNAETTGHDVGVYPVEGGWSEGMVTENTRPALGDSVEAFDFQSCDECVRDLTGLATDWVTGDVPNNGVALRAPDASSAPTFSVGFFSRHVESPLRRPLVLVAASTNSVAVRAERGRPSGGTLSLEDDIRSGLIYGVSPENRVVRTKRLR